MQSIYPVLKYEDAHSAIDFLERAFCFERHAVYDGEHGGVGHAELRLGDEYVMLGSTNEGEERFNQGAGRYSLYVVVDDPDAHHARAKEAGARIERELADQHYGSREYTARDPEATSGASGPTARARRPPQTTRHPGAYSSGEGVAFGDCPG